LDEAFHSIEPSGSARPTLSPAERAAAFRSWAANHPRNTPVLRVCADFFPACSVVLFTILRAPRMRFLRHRGIYRPDRGSLKNQTWAGALPPAGSSHPGPRTRREDHALPIVPMSSDRLFLDRVARQCGAIGIMGKTRKELSAIMGAPGAVAVGRVCSGAHLEPVRPVWPRVA
jgi:hypothetical protein